MAHLIVNQRVVAEEFDGEIVLIDVEKGLYFSLQGAAIDLWRSFATARPADTVIAHFAKHMADADRDALDQTISRMQGHELLVAGEASAGAASPLPEVTSVTFVTPALEVYSDLAELIAIDPVHEVDASAGWPLRPASFPDAS